MGTISTAYRLYSIIATKPLPDQIRECARQYTAKEGQAPNLARCHTDLLAAAMMVDDIKVTPERSMLRSDLWLACYIEPAQPQLF